MTTVIPATAKHSATPRPIVPAPTTAATRGQPWWERLSSTRYRLRPQDAPAHDQRDLDFARKYGLPVISVVRPEGAGEDFDVADEAYVGPGRIFNSADLDGLDVVIEIRSKWFESRAANRQARVDTLHEAISTATGLTDFGVYLSLPVAAWSQGD